ncbi:hypothetical protein SNE40_011953 [Patella caerulea]|uniref:Uncharacterized protein n=1 Tax=Patella caerulea TaxID=87958 RepID=A0AAN8PMG6_PATCE
MVKFSAKRLVGQCYNISIPSILAKPQCGVHFTTYHQGDHKDDHYRYQHGDYHGDDSDSHHGDECGDHHGDECGDHHGDEIHDECVTRFDLLFFSTKIVLRNRAANLSKLQ